MYHYVCFVIMYSIKTTGDTVHHFGLNCWLQPPKIFHGVDVAPLKKRLGTPDIRFSRAMSSSLASVFGSDKPFLVFWSHF